MRRILGFVLGLVAGRKADEKYRLQKAFSSYLVARGQIAIFPESHGHAGLVDLASIMGIETESIRGARDELYRLFPAHVSETIERMLTGDIWTEDMGGPAGRGSS